MKNRRRNSKKKGGRNKNKKPATTTTNDTIAVADNDTTTIANTNSEWVAATLTLQLSNMKKSGLCFHGMSEGYVDAVGRDALQSFLVDVYSHDCKESTVNHLANLQMLHLVHPVMDQPGMIQLLYGLAATFSLQEWTTPNLKKAMLTLRAALYLDKCMEKPSREDHHHRLMEKWLQVKWYNVKHCGSIHDAIVYLDKKVPCHCLADLKTKVLATPEVRVCDYCNNETSVTMKCSKCTMVEFCSKQCQQSDWPIHEMECQFCCGKIKSDEFVQHLGN